MASLWKFRHLVRQLAARELKARYKVSVLGFFWSLLRPLLTIVVLSAVFSLLEFKSDRYIVSYPAFLLVSYLPWYFFAGALLEGTLSLLGNSHLIKKVYSPREVYPASVTLANLINFLLALAVLLPVLYLIMGVKPGPSLLHLPLVILTQTAFLLGLCFIASVLNVLYRDTGQIVEFAVFVWFYITPVLYDITQIKAQLPAWGFTLYFANPMAGLIEWYRYVLLSESLLRDEAVQSMMAFLFYRAVPFSAVASFLTLGFGYWLLKRLETRAVDTL